MPVNRPLTILVITYLFLGLVYDQATPTFEASDEVWHFGVVRELAEGRGLPVQRPGVLTTYRQEGSQPPGYYAAAAALTFWIDTSDFAQHYVYNPFAQAGVPGTLVNANMMRHTDAEAFPWTGVTLVVHVLRWFSLLLGVGTILLTHHLAALLFPGRASLALLAAAFTAFNPMFLFISAAVNNDNALWLVSSLAIYLVARAAQHEITGLRRTRRSVIDWLLSPQRLPWVLGGVLGLAIMVKLSGLVLAPVIAAFMLWRAWRRRDWPGLVRDAAIVGLCVAVLTGWWFARNVVLYDELLGVRTMAAIYGLQRAGPVALLELIGEAQGWWYSFWGIFGVFNILPGLWVYGIYSGLVLLALIGAVRLLRSSRAGTLQLFGQHAPHLFSLLLLGLTFAANIYWTSTQFASQGRLMFGALSVSSTFLAAGLMAALAPRSERRTSHFIIGVLMAVAAIIPFLYIAPAYASPPEVAAVDLPASMRPVRALIGEEIELLGYSFDDAPLQPGDVLPVTLYWRARSAIGADYNLALNLHGRALELVGKLDTWPGGGSLPTSAWTPGAIYADTYALPVAAGARAPSLLRLDITFWEGELSDRLPIQAPDGSLLPTLLLDVGALVPARAATIEPAALDGSTFEGGFALLGYDVPTQGAPGGELPVVLYWEVAPAPAADFTVFLHLQDAGGNTVAQADGPPVGGDWPTSVWRLDGPVVDRHVLAIPGDLPDGEYRLSIGLYDPDSGARLPAFSAAGDEWSDWAVRPRAPIVISAP